jgi:type I restriction enzyme, R subunit
MPSSKFTYALSSPGPNHVVREDQIEYGFIGKLQNLKYDYRDDIRDRASLERNFREKFEALNRVHLTDGEFARLLDEIVTPDVFTAAKTLRTINSFTREDGTPLNFTLVNIKDWCVDFTYKLSHHFAPILSHLVKDKFGYSIVDKSMSLACS